eukprot:3155037-Prymnesium_polylepis.1
MSVNELEVSACASNHSVQFRTCLGSCARRLPHAVLDCCIYIERITWAQRTKIAGREAQHVSQPNGRLMRQPGR